MRNIIALLHPIEKKETIRIDFQTELLETDIYEKLKLPEYGIYQFIENDFLYNMEQSELDAEQIKYYELKREKKNLVRTFKKNNNGFTNSTKKQILLSIPIWALFLLVY